MNIPDLKSFPESSRTKVSRIEEMYEAIRYLNKSGISYRDIAAKLTEQGMPLSPQNLTSMLSRIDKKRSNLSISKFQSKGTSVNNLLVGPSSSLPNSELINAHREEDRPYAHQKDGKKVADEVW